MNQDEPISHRPAKTVAEKQHLGEHIYQAMLILNKVTQGLSLQKSVQELNRRHKKTSDYAKALSYLAIRQYHLLGQLIDCFANKKLSPQVRNLISIAFVLLIQKKNIHQAFTVVDQSTDAAKIHPKTSHAAGLINALLRNYLRCVKQLEASAPEENQINERNERNEANEASEANQAAFQKFKSFWQVHQSTLEAQSISAEYVFNELPQAWQAELNRTPEKIEQLIHTKNHPPMMLRINPLQNSREEYLKKLQQAGLNARAFDLNLPHFDQDAHGISALTPHAIEIIFKNEDALYQKDPSMPDVKTLPDFITGAFAVQDAAAQITPQLLDLQNGMRVLDACSAPGGKIFSCLEQYQLDVDCVEIDEERAQKITENYQRLHLSTQATRFNMHTQSMAEYTAAFDLKQDNLFDRIILDVPCSSSGVLRKHPEMIFAREAFAPQELAQLQFEMLTQTWPLLKTGGILLYITCSIFSVEGVDLIEKFCTEHSDCILMPSPLHISIAEQHDGFFYARLKKAEKQI